MLEPGLRIGQLAQRLGVSDHLLRAWERRYALFDPRRTPAGYRLYGEADERRAQAVLRLTRHGAPVAEAARLALLEVPIVQDGPAPHHGTREIVTAALAAVGDFDTTALGDALSRTRALPLETVVGEVVLPLLRGLDMLVDDGPPTVAHTRLGAEALRAELLARPPVTTAGDGPTVWLACPAREAHDLALLCFGLLLTERGVRVRFLGANTPLAALTRAAVPRPPDAVVLAATRPRLLHRQRDELVRLADVAPVWIAGASASPALAASTGTRHISRDVVSAAQTFDPAARDTGALDGRAVGRAARGS